MSRDASADRGRRAERLLRGRQPGRRGRRGGGRGDLRAHPRRAGYDHVVATRDHHVDPGHHFAEHPDFLETWPAHCVVGTGGVELHPALDREPLEAVFDKGEYAAAYSGFEGAADGVAAGRLAARARGGRRRRRRHRHRPLRAGDRAGRRRQRLRDPRAAAAHGRRRPEARPRPPWTQLRTAGVELEGAVHSLTGVTDHGEQRRSGYAGDRGGRIAPCPRIPDVGPPEGPGVRGRDRGGLGLMALGTFGTFTDARTPFPPAGVRRPLSRLRGATRRRSAAGHGVEHLVAGEAEHLQHRVEVGLVERGVRLLAHERLGVEGDAEAGGVQHVEVVGAVADGDGLLERDAVLRGEPRQRPRLARRGRRSRRPGRR